MLNASDMNEKCPWLINFTQRYKGFTQLFSIQIFLRLRPTNSLFIFFMICNYNDNAIDILTNTYDLRLNNIETCYLFGR